MVDVVSGTDGHQCSQHIGPFLSGLGGGLGSDVPLGDLLYHFQLCVGQLPAVRRRRRFWRFLHAEEPAHGDAEPAAEGHQLVDLRKGGV